MRLTEVLRSDGYYTLNKKLIKELGLNTAVYLTNLIDKYAYLKQRRSLYWDKTKKRHLVFSSVSNIEEHTGLKRRSQDESRKQLELLDIIEVEMRGVPRTAHFWINEASVWRLLQTGLDNITNKGGEYNKQASNIRQTISKNTSKPIYQDYNSETIGNFLDFGFCCSYLDGGNSIPTDKLTEEMIDLLLSSGYCESDGKITTLVL